MSRPPASAPPMLMGADFLPDGAPHRADVAVCRRFDFRRVVLEAQKGAVVARIGGIGPSNQRIELLVESSPGTSRPSLRGSSPALMYFERICAGGYPEALDRADRRRQRWFDEYIRRITERDAPDLSKRIARSARSRRQRLSGAETSDGSKSCVTNSGAASLQVLSSTREVLPMRGETGLSASP